MKANNRRARLVPVGLISLVSLVLLCGDDCGRTRRDCIVLRDNVITIGGAGVLIGDCFHPAQPPLLDLPIRIARFEDAQFLNMPKGLSGMIVPDPDEIHLRAFKVTANAGMMPGTVAFMLHTFLHGAPSSPLALDYRVTVTLVSPPPTPPPLAVTVTAAPNPVATGASTTLSAIVMGGVGPFTYAWRGYRDDGEHSGSFSLSSAIAQSPQASVSYPNYSYYFFCTVTDTGVKPNATATGFVRVYETKGPIARVSITPAMIKATVSKVKFDGTSSTNAVNTFPTSWSIDYGGSTVPTSLEGILQKPVTDWKNVCGEATSCGSTSLTLSYGPFASAGIYRVQLNAFDALSNGETSTEYFVVSP